MSMTDKDYYNLTLSISKALGQPEQPIKTKHIRSAIIGTFHSKGAHAFWAIAIRQPLQENRIIAWKFCHLLHKVLREGHPLCCQQSMRHRGMLTEVGKLWGHLNDGYGICIKHYTKLLVTKLEFHDRNPRIPGSLALKRGELEHIGGNDINFYFQLAVEIFDYLDDIVALQATIFHSITTFCVSSMTPAGQCRLAPLIPCIQDSNPLYDFVVRIMFKLHANLPADLLSGHRDRFKTLFKQLKTFYSQSKNLQYFVNLITVPKLPDSPPNFEVQSDFKNYTAPVVVMPEGEVQEENFVDNLVDTHESQSLEPPPIPELPQQNHLQKSVPPPDNFEKIIKDRDDLIKHLQGEIERISYHVKARENEQRNINSRLEEHVAQLSAELTNTRGDLSNIRIEKEELELKAQTAPTLEQKAHAEEERAKATEEKFQKLKTMYTQIRDEHVNLLRQHGEMSKLLATTKKEAAEAANSKEEIQCQLQEVQESQKKMESTLQQTSTSTLREKEEVVFQLKEVNRQYEDLKSKYDEVEAHRQAEIAELTINLDKLTRELGIYQNEQENLNEKKNGLEVELEVARSQKMEVDAKYKDCLDTILELKENLSNLNNLQHEHKLLKQKCNILEIGLSATETEFLTYQGQQNSKYDTLKMEMSQQLINLEDERESISAANNEQRAALQIIERQFLDRSAEFSQMENDLKAVIEQKDHEIAEIDKKYKDMLESKIHGETALRTLLETCIKSSENMTIRAASESEMPGMGGTPTYFLMIAEELQDVLTKLSLVHENYLKDTSNNVESLARKVILTGHLLASAHVQGLSICNNTANIEHGERIAEEIKEMAQSASSFFEAIQSVNEADNVTDRINNLKEKLNAVTVKIGELSRQTDGTGQIADLVESELATMDKAIEEAAIQIEEMLSKSRASDSGIKLEVNEKILDACTSLMQAIRILVQKSKLVQHEIVAVGKGSASVKEFYKRNHQWTEGLISAAKSVAQGANFLVTAANKTVVGGAKHQLDLIVAAQEIAACTAQLVIASRVKAPRDSVHLTALGSASRNVTQATGNVVATAKNCSQRMEDSQDLDFSNLTVHQAKTKEMELQVKVLELEQGLQVERMRLAALRRKNYQSAE